VIPTIGLMVGAYIFTRMMETLVNDKAPASIRVLAGLTGAVALFGAFDLVVSGSSGIPRF
jgi:hypothetical protein